MFFKKISAVMALTLLLAVLLCSCNTSSQNSSDKIEVLCTNYPLYDWVQNITKGSDSVNVDFLLKNGVDIHSFQPSADDIIRISSADLFVYNDGMSEKYLTDIINNSDVSSVAASEILSENLIASEHSHDETHHDEYDEHIWLSVKNAIKICDAISKKIIEIDPENSDIYLSNTENYIAELSALDESYSNMVNSSARNELVIADRYPFVYLMNDYELICHSAFPGCSDETDASFATIISLSEKIAELNMPVVLTTDGNNNSIAEAVIASSGIENIDILSLNSMQTITDAEIKAGKTYLSAMKENLEILHQTLN